MKAQKQRKLAYFGVAALVILLIALVVVVLVFLVGGTNGETLVFKANGSVSHDRLAVDANIISQKLEERGFKNVNVSVGEDNTVNVSVDKGSVDRVKRLLMLNPYAVQFRIVLDEKKLSDIQNDPQSRNDPSWQVSTGAELKADKPVTLPFKENGIVENLKLGPTEMTGAVVKKARVEKDPNTGSYKVACQLTGTGSATLASLTEKNVNRRMAIIVNNKVVTAPTIKEAIRGGNFEITGKFSKPEVDNISDNLGAALPLELEFVRIQK